jgi:Pentatricopeptide repeat domain
MWERSVNLLTDMKAASLQPDVFTYMSVITACDTAKQRELALQLSAEMEQVNFNWWSCLFQACCAYCASIMCAKS